MESLQDIVTGALYRTTVVTTSNSIELPAEIDDLIDNKAYRPRYKKLIREGYLTQLLQLADLAREMGDKPSHLFAKYCSVANWSRTLEFLAELRDVAVLAADVCRRLAVPTDDQKGVLAACWRFGASVIQTAVKCAEVGRNRIAYFYWHLDQKNNALASGRTA